MAEEQRPTRIGIIGAGQLGRMLALAGYPLGLRFCFVDKSADAPGGQVGEIITGEFSDPEKLEQLAERVDVMTFDVENVPVSAVNRVVDRIPFYPPPAALEIAQDRLDEKHAFGEHGIPTPAYRPVDSLEDLKKAVDELGCPCVLKTRRLGYDGKGQKVLESPADIEPAWDALAGVPLILEQFIDFEREVSVIGVRSRSGDLAYYPISENTHRDGILRYSVAPYPDERLQERAQQHVRKIMETTGYAGILTIEFFVKDGELIANEMAPRVHNSGHWTIEGAVTSQFENHIRAILDLPLGDTSVRGHAAMINFLGEMPPVAEMLAINGLHYHDYGKSPRPGRKLGHATISHDDRDRVIDGLERILARL